MKDDSDNQLFKKVEEPKEEAEEKKDEEKKTEEGKREDEPKVVNTAAPKEDKSFFEIMWEREHPEEVKKMQLAEEQKKMAEKAKKLQEEA